MQIGWIYLMLLAWQEILGDAEAFRMHDIGRREINLHPSSTSGTLSSASSASPSIKVKFSVTYPAPFYLSTPSKSSLQNEASVGTSRHSQPRSQKETMASPLSEAEVTPERTSESELKNEPEGTGAKTEPSAEPETWPEPGPEWKKAFIQWKLAWPIHVYVFAIAFLIIGFYAGYYVALNIYDGLGGKYLSVGLNAMVLLFGTTRAFVLFFDPYHQGDLINAIFVMRLLWSIGGPCLTASDCLIIMALVETSRVSIAPPKFQKIETISIVIAIHFVLVIVSDTVVSMYMEAKIMILMCQIFFSVWGITLGAGYVNLAYKLDKKLFSHKQVKDKADKIYIFLIYASGVANFFICGVMIYTMVGVFGVYADITFVDAWHWWTLQTLFRTSEVVTCILIFTVSAKRARVKMAVDEVSEISSLSQTLDGRSAFPRLQMFFKRIRNRGRVVDSETGESVTNTFKKEIKDTANDGENVLPPVLQAFTKRGRVRRQSLFSHVQQATIENRIAQLEEAPAVVTSGRRRRRQSLFSAMHEASISNAISNFANAMTQGNVDIVCESLESNEDPNEDLNNGPVSAPPPRRGRRANVFSTVQETKPDKHQAKMEDIKEESVYENESESIRRPPLLKKQSSERLRQIVLSLLPSVSKDRGGQSKNIVEVEENESSSADSNSIPFELA